MGVLKIKVYRTIQPGLPPVFHDKPCWGGHEEFEVTLTKAGVIAALNGFSSMEMRSGMVTGVVETLNKKTTGAPKEAVPVGEGPMYRVDPEDAEKLKGKSPSYIRGWNAVKDRRKHG